MFKLLYHKFIQYNVYQILSESTWFCGKYDKNILVCFLYCSHFTLGNAKSDFQQYYSYILQTIYIISEENKLLLPLLTTPEKCHRTTL